MTVMQKRCAKRMAMPGAMFTLTSPLIILCRSILCSQFPLSWAGVEQKSLKGSTEGKRLGN